MSLLDEVESGIPMWSEGGGGADTIIEVDFDVDSLYFSSIAVVESSSPLN